MRETLSTWRRRSGWLLAVGLLLAANVAFFFWYRGSGQKRQEALEARRASLAAEVAAAEREAERVTGQSRRLTQVSKAIEEFYGKRIGSQRATQAAIVDEIHNLLKRVGVAPSQIGYTIELVPKLPLSQMTAGFSFDADYAKFKQLLELFEMGPRWLVVKEISVARNADVPGVVQVRMVVATYFAEENSEAPPAPTGRGVPAAAPRKRS